MYARRRCWKDKMIGEAKKYRALKNCKVREAKLMLIMPLVVVMLAMMVGIAIAEDISIEPRDQPVLCNQNEPDGVYATYTIHVTNSGAPQKDSVNCKPPERGQPIKVRIKDSHTTRVTQTSHSGGAGNDLLFKISKGTSETGWEKNPSLTWDDTGNNDVTLTLKVMNTGTVPHAQYKFMVKDRNHGTDVAEEEAGATAYA